MAPQPSSVDCSSASASRLAGGWDWPLAGGCRVVVGEVGGDVVAPGGLGLAKLPQTPEAAADHFGHRGEVVGAVHGFDFEASVFAGGGASIEEDDHRGDGAVALVVGDVVALDAVGWGGESERLLDLGEGGGGVAAVGHPADALHVERFAGVLGGHFDEASFLAALRVADLDGAAAFFGEQAVEQFDLVDGVGNQDEPGDLHGAFVVLTQEGGEHGLERLVLHAGEREMVAAGHLLAADEEHLDDGFVAVNGDPEGVDFGFG